MAIALRFITKKVGGSATSIQTDAGFNSVTGDTLFVAISDPNANLTIADTIDGVASGNTWTRVGTQFLAGVTRLNLWRCENANGGNNHRVTITATSGNMNAAVHFGAISDAAVSSFDLTVQGTDNSSPYEITTGTLAQANELAIAFAGCEGSVSAFSVGGGFSIASQEVTHTLYWTSAVATRITSATDALTPSFTTTGSVGANLGIIVATFKEVSAGGGGVLIPAKGSSGGLTSVSGNMRT